MAADASFPVFDLACFEAGSAEEKAPLGAEIDAICRSTGFLAVAGHGVPQATIDEAWRKAEAFFSLPPELKGRAKAPYPGYPYGYLAPETESLARSRGVDAPPDKKESFNGGPLRAPLGLTDPEALGFCFAPTIWPDEPEGFREAWRAYYAAMEDLAARIMRALAVALTLPEDFFAPFIDAPISALRALNYPALAGQREPGEIRAGAHTDYGSLTILLPQAGSRGLEILAPDGSWTEVEPVPGAFIVNIGDLMARWTNDRWTSTLHRVVIPADGGAAPRQSFAFFHQPNWDAGIVALEACLEPGETVKYPPVKSGPYLMGKFKSTTAEAAA
ncbi:MAG: isopenicillin N synthase family oxygenase [Hyphomicrobiales bacterium]|nr:isopenicillin N synthase family oxygenase [Hyphomicrobiales bacterium]